MTKGSPGYRPDVMAGGAVGHSAERGQEPGERVLGGEISLAPDVLLTLSRCSGNVYGLKRPISMANRGSRKTPDPREGAKSGSRRVKEHLV